MPQGIWLQKFGDIVADYFGHVAYHVGSSLNHKDWRDVDVRLILPDDEFAEAFGIPPNHVNKRLAAITLAFCALGKEMTGLPVDFQIQSQTRANQVYGGQPRSALVEVHPQPPTRSRMVTFVPGRLPPHPPETHPRLYARGALRSGYQGRIPDTCDYYTGVVFPMYENDRIGDCTEADSGHAISVFTARGQHQEVDVTDQDVITAYSRVSGYDPSQDQPDGTNPTDVGAVIQDVLGDWRRNGIADHKILAFLQVDHTNHDEIQACIWLFGGVRIGVDLPRSAEDQFNAGEPWSYDPAADNTILGGHDVRLVGYDRVAGTYTAVTWGGRQQVTRAWIQAFCVEGWCEADGSWVKNGTSPEGLDVAALNQAFQAITGEPGPFPVTPTPVPPGPAVDPADEALAAAVRPELTHLSHHGSARTVHNALLTWLRAKQL